MNLSELTRSDLTEFPAPDVAAAAIRAALRVLPIYMSWSSTPADYQELQQGLSVAEGILFGNKTTHSIDDIAERAYQIAAAAAKEFRKSKNEAAGRASVAGAIIHSAIDAVADLNGDVAAVLTNSMLALRGCAKLQSPGLTQAVVHDLQALEPIEQLGEERAIAESSFRPLWPGVVPDWFEME